MAKPKPATFEIATYEGPNSPPGRAERKGYVAGKYGMVKEKYSYEFTHLPTGMKLNFPPWIEKKGEALAYLETLQDTPLPDYLADMLASARWGGR